MFFTVVTSIATICIGVMLVWGWVAFIAEAIARRTGRTSAVPYPDEALWACFGRSLLDIGLFGGEFSLTQRRKGNLLLRRLRGRLSRSQNIVLGAGPDTEAEQHAVLHNAGASEACPSGEGRNRMAELGTKTAGEGVNVAHRV